MGLIEIRQIIATALAESKEFDQIQPLGHCIYVHFGGEEYEVVLRTVRCGDSRPITKLDEEDKVP